MADDVVSSQVDHLQLKEPSGKDYEPMPDMAAKSPTSDEEELPLGKLSPHALVEERPVKELTAHFVVARHGSVRRLHRVGSSWRIPG